MENQLKWSKMRHRQSAWIATRYTEDGSLTITLYQEGNKLFTYNYYIETCKVIRQTHGKLETDSLEAAKSRAEKIALKAFEICVKDNAAIIAAGRRKRKET